MTSFSHLLSVSEVFLSCTGRQEQSTSSFFFYAAIMFNISPVDCQNKFVSFRSFLRDYFICRIQEGFDRYKKGGGMAFKIGIWVPERCGVFVSSDACLICFNLEDELTATTLTHTHKQTISHTLISLTLLPLD